MAGEKPEPDLIDTSFFLNLQHGNWWEFRDLNTGSAARLDCRTSGSTLTVTLTVGPEVSEQLFQIKDGSFTLTESRVPAQQLLIRWQGGMTLPAQWRIGESVSALSQSSANPATGNAVKLTTTLARLGQFAPPAPPFVGIEVRQTLKDEGLGIVLGNANLHFAGSRGLTYVTGQAFGRQFVLKPEKWYGQP
jgi:hypothetical protein